MEMKDILKQHSDAIDMTLTGFGEQLHKSIEAMTTLDVRLRDIEQKGSRMSLAGGGEFELKTLGGEFVKAPGLKNFADAREHKASFRVETKAVLTSDPASVGGALPHPYRDAAVMIPKRNLVVRSLLPVIPVSTGSVEYPHQLTRNNAAAPVAENPTAVKPQSDFTMDLKTTPVRTIAHWIQASRQILDDMPQLEGLINSELLYGLGYVEDYQLLLGDGTGVNINGMIPQASVFALPSGMTAATAGVFLDQLGQALLQCALGNFSPDGIVLHPTDWWKLRLLKDGQGKYLLGDPGEAVEPRIFGLPVVTTQAMPQGHYLVGQFQVAAVLYDRMMAAVMASSEDRDNFVRNLVTLLAEERIALAVKRPTALVYGTFS